MIRKHTKFVTAQCMVAFRVHVQRMFCYNCHLSLPLLNECNTIQSKTTDFRTVAHLELFAVILSRSPLRNNRTFAYEVMEEKGSDDEIFHDLISTLDFEDPKEKLKWFQCKKCEEVGVHLFVHSCLHIICESCLLDQHMCPVCGCDSSGIGMTKVTQMEYVKTINVFCPLKTNSCQDSISILDIVEHVKSSHSEQLEQLVDDPNPLKTVPVVEKNKDVEELTELIETLKESLKIAKNDVNKLQKQVNALEDSVQNERKERLKLQHEIQMFHTSGPSNSHHGVRVATEDQDVKSLPSEQNLQNELRVSPKDSISYTWRLHDFPRVLRDLKNQRYGEHSSPVFATADPSLQMRVNLCFHAPHDHVSIFMGFVTEDAAPRPVFYHRRTVIVQDQSGQPGRKRDIVRVYEPGFGREDAEMWMKGFYGWWRFAPVHLLLDDVRYVRDGALLVQVLIEPLASLYRKFSSNVGVLFWSIADYREVKQDEVDEVVDCLRSDFFYSTRTGYRMRMRAHLNGWQEGRGTYLALFLCFQKGQFDDTLPSRVHYRLTCVLLDQSISFVKNDLVKVTERLDDRLDVGQGFPEFALQAAVEQPLYLRNNTLSIKVLVEVL